MKCRVFSTTVGWSEVIFIIDENINFKDVKRNLQTSMLNKHNYVGLFDFDEKYLKLFNYKLINGFKYFYKYSYEDEPK